MCYGCYEENGKPAIVNDKTKKAAELITNIYNQKDGAAGGYAHIVTDDWNLTDDDIEYCINSANEKSSEDYISEQCRLVCIECLNYIKELTLEERYSAMALSNDFIN